MGLYNCEMDIRGLFLAIYDKGLAGFYYRWIMESYIPNGKFTPAE